jgi:chlorobactene glucosyltransferase
MLALVCGAAWAALVIYLLCRILRQFRTFRETALAASIRTEDLPSVSIIVPVRNEIENIEHCIADLSAQTCLGERFAIIIVDDDSQDGSAGAIAGRVARDRRVKAIPAGALPGGWVGKPNACWRGALAAEGEWLCFVDADVRAEPRLVASAVRTARAHSIDMLSLHPLQELGSFWERVIIPAGLLTIASAKRFRTASEDVANGQFLLIRREAYFQVGGHAAVRGEICEDKALALRVKAAGLRFRVLSAAGLARTRMYRGLRSLWEGLAKNAADILGSPGATLAAAIGAALFGWGTLLVPAVAGVAFAADPGAAPAAGLGLAVLGSSVVTGVHIAMARHFRIPAAYGLLLVLGYTIAACLACYSVLAHIDGRVTWKGRTYRLHKSAPERT